MEKNLEKMNESRGGKNKKKKKVEAFVLGKEDARRRFVMRTRKLGQMSLRVSPFIYIECDTFVPPRFSRRNHFPLVIDLSPFILFFFSSPFCSVKLEGSDSNKFFFFSFFYSSFTPFRVSPTFSHSSARSV